jgi:hypothetical protein
MVRFKGLVGPTYSVTPVNVDCQRCVNQYPQIIESQAGTNGEIGALIGTPGLRLLATIGNGPIRGAYATSGGKFAIVSGNGLYQVQNDWTYSLVGTLNTSVGPVGMADNGTQLCVVDGPYGYIVSLVDGTFTQITSDGFAGGVNVVFLDGYFVTNTPNTGQFNRSALYDGLSWDALDFNTAEGSPDALVTVLASRRQLWMLGAETTEVYWDSGSDTTFSRFEGSFSQYGCASAAAAVVMNNTPVWLGSGENASGIVWMAEGYQPKRISNHAVEEAIQAAGDLSTATAYAYQSKGHLFYCLSLPNTPSTWVYDLSTQQWHERSYLNNGLWERHRGERYAWVYGTDVVGDYQNGNLYALDSAVYTDNGAPLKRMRRSPHVSTNMKRQFHHKLTIDCQMGTGLDGTQYGTDPVITIRWSDDFGNTWSTERSKPLGRIGQFANRVYFDRLGMTRNRVYEISTTSPVPYALLGAELEITGGAS